MTPCLRLLRNRKRRSLAAGNRSRKRAGHGRRHVRLQTTEGASEKAAAGALCVLSSLRGTCPIVSRRRCCPAPRHDQRRGGSVTSRPPLPPFTEQSAREKVQAAEDAWNSCDPERVAVAYTEDSQWRNRAEFFQGRDAIRDFLRRKWEREQGLPAQEGALVLPRQSYLCPLRVRIARPGRSMVAQPRQRALGIRRARADAPT
jgi:hypothetical protein